MNEKGCNERHKALAERLDTMEKQRNHDKNTVKSEQSALLERHLRLEKEAFESSIIMKKDIEIIKKDLAEMKQVMQEFIEAAPAKFASKRVEIIVFGMVGVILLGFLAQVLKGIIK